MIRLPAFLLLLALSTLAFAQNDLQTQVQYLSGTDRQNTVEWEFQCTDGRQSGKWMAIPVPSNWELQGFGTYNYGHDHRSEDIELGKEHGLYRHTFTVPEVWEGREVHIVFDGAMTDTKVEINGKSAGAMHQGGFNRFRYDISDLLKYGKNNKLEVDVAKHSSNASVNRAEREADFWIFGGIYRPVFLEAYPKTHFERVAIDAKADGRLTAHVFPNMEGVGKVELELFTLDGQKIGETFVQGIAADEEKVDVQGKFFVNPWSAEFPHLYIARFSLYQGAEKVHEQAERIGFRTVELRPHDGFYINGEKIVLKGVNRHSFWPESGRCLSDQDHLLDIRLMKEMNMNAVRSSHYTPDKRFVELCDSLGLYLLDELTGWQQGYDTIVGPKLIKELILRDENNASVIIWNHGNEGGWTFANEKWFHEYDFQKRPILYPWLLRNDVDTRHYPGYQDNVSRFMQHDNVFMPTELLHGLYDGGHGAGLDDYWALYKRSPVLGGGFLWVFSDEAIWRTDEQRYDSDGNHAPDGILGPHREKEASFYTIKEIWSPVQIETRNINGQFDGQLMVTNEYDFTNLSQCQFSWQALRLPQPGETGIGLLAGKAIIAPNIAPGETGMLDLGLPDNFAEADLLTFTATDPHGQDIYTWTWPVQTPKQLAAKILSQEDTDGDLTVSEQGGQLSAKVGALSIVFDTQNGTIESVENQNGAISLSGGPVPVGFDSKLKNSDWWETEDGKLKIRTEYEEFPAYVEWTLHPSGLLHLEVAPMQQNQGDIELLGVTFNYPEELVTGIQWVGKGPYRVWKNRTKGTNVNFWQKGYNNTITGQSFDSLIYPEFKGYHGDLYWAVLQTEESPFTIISETDNLFLHLFTPTPPDDPARGATANFPEGDISFLYDIPGIGTKFRTAEDTGPAAQATRYLYRTGDQPEPMRLWFDFR